MTTRMDKEKAKAKLEPSRGRYGLQLKLGGGQLDLFQLDGELLRDALAHVVLEGDALLFGMTRDQTALKVQVLTDSGAEEVYVGSIESLEIVLRAMRDVET